MVLIKKCLLFVLFVTCSLEQTFGMLGRTGSQVGRKTPSTKPNLPKQQHFGQKSPSYSPWKATFARYFWGKSKKETDWNEEFRNWGQPEKEKKGWANFFKTTWSNLSNKSARTESLLGPNFEAIVGKNQGTRTPAEIIQKIQETPNAYGQDFMGNTVLHHIIKNQFSDDAIVAIIEHLDKNYKRSFLNKLFRKKWPENIISENALDAAINYQRGIKVIKALCENGALDEKIDSGLMNLLFQAQKHQPALNYLNDDCYEKISSKIKKSSTTIDTDINNLKRWQYSNILKSLLASLGREKEFEEYSARKDAEKKAKQEYDDPEEDEKGEQAWQEQQERSRRDQANNFHSDPKSMLFYVAFQPCKTVKEVKTKYYELIRRYHPDRFSDPEKKAAAEEDCKKLNTIYNKVIARVQK